MMELVVGLGGFTLGCLVAGIVAGGVAKRLVDRLQSVHQLTETTLDLEKRRVARDSVRQHQPRPGAGQPARVVDAMPSHRASLSTNQFRSKTSLKKNPANGGHGGDRTI